MGDIDNGKDGSEMKDQHDVSGAAEAPVTRGGSSARKWVGIGVLAAGVVLAGISFDIMQSRATAGGAGTPGPEIPGGAVETGARQSGSTRVASRGGCGSGCGQSARRSCCSTSAASGGAAQPGALQLDPGLSADQWRERVAAYYAKQLGGPVTVEIEDYGCHQEAEVLKDGKPVKRLAISGGTVTEIS